MSAGAGGSRRRIHGLAPREDVERELRFHLAMRERELVVGGWDEASARAEAQRLFGDYDGIRGECEVVAKRTMRTRRRVTMLSEGWQDLRYAVRWLTVQPGFALVAIVTLALGIGANSAVFGIVRAVLLSPLPYPDSDRLVAVWEANRDGTSVPVSYPNFLEWREQTQSMRMTAHTQAWRVTVLGGAEPVMAPVSSVSREFFDVLGVAPAVGRVFDAEELAPGGRAAVVVSDVFWREQLGGERDLSRLRVAVHDAVASVVGVMPPGFSYPRGAELWVPLERLPATAYGTRTAHNFVVTARLAPGATQRSAQAELGRQAAAIRVREGEGLGAVKVAGLHEELVGNVRTPLLILLGASGLVLLVACTNLASALLSRAAGRRRELAVRAALGAHRLRLVRQLLTESLLLASLGAIAGLLLAYLVIQGLQALGPAAVPRLDEVRLDGWVLLFTTLLVAATTLTFGTAPALRATAAGPFEALRGAGRGTEAPRQRRTWAVLVGAEVALALMLLVGSGLLIRSFWNVIRTDPGFDPAGVLQVQLSLPPTHYPEGESRVRYYDHVLERANAVAGVEHASMTTAVPISGGDRFGMFRMEGIEEWQGPASYRVVSPDFFSAMRVPLLSGRTFTAADRQGALDVTVVNHRFAERFFPDGDAIGRRITTGGMDAHMERWVTIVGVVGDVRHRALTSPPEAAYYLPYAQRPDRTGSAALVVRAAASAASVAPALRAAIVDVDSNVPVTVGTLSAAIGESLAERRFMLLVLGTFAAAALLLSAVGIYGVVAYAVARRTHEIGIRMALGAERSRVLWLVSRTTMGSVCAGLAVGMLGALFLARLTGALLYGVEPIDMPTFAAVTLVLLATAWIAVLVPASRAIQVSPSAALRAD